MKIRSITYFDNPGQSLTEEFLGRAERFRADTIDAYRESEIELQTIRFASAPFPTYLKGLSSDQIIDYTRRLEGLLIEQGYAYLSIGPALPENPLSYGLIPELIGATEATFCSGALTVDGSGLSLAAAKACGEVIECLTPLDPDGFANLFFTALGNVSAGTPFFPAAYHSGGPPAFAVAVEGADLAVDAFGKSTSLDSARKTLIREMERVGDEISMAGKILEGRTGAEYKGIDFSLAPFPDPRLSTGAAFEKLGLDRFGEHGSLAAAAFLADTIDRADFRRTGFSGLMLPVLEDAVLAARAADGSLSLKDLLMYSAVCGTGLDTVPLPGDTSADEISAVLIDLAALSLRLDKPLTARLMPIPGKEAGDPTEFDFKFFANSRVLSLESTGLNGLLAGSEWIDIKPRGE